LQVGSLAPQPGTVIHDLAIDFPRCEVDKAQSLTSGRAAHPNLRSAFA
jgi:hypothetical protein